MRYYYPPPRRAGLHRRMSVPVGGFGQIDPGGLTAVAAQICAAGGGTWTGNECVMPGGQAPPPGTTVGTGFPPGTMPSACGPDLPCPPGSTCMPAPVQVQPFLPPGVSSICMPEGAVLPTTPPGPGTGPPPSMPPPQTQPPPPQTQPPGLPPPKPEDMETPQKSLFGLPPMAVYIGLGALGLLAVAAVVNKDKKRR